MARIRPFRHHPLRVWVGIAGFGALASVLRYAVTAGGGWGAVLVANAVGCAVLGVLVARGRATPALAVGLCGGLTTFSGVAAQALVIARGETLGATSTTGAAALQHWPSALAVLGANALLGLVAFLGAHRAAANSTGSAVLVGPHLGDRR